MKTAPFFREILNELECIHRRPPQTSNQLLHEPPDVTLDENKGESRRGNGQYLKIRYLQ
jgi:hypothetical protein